MAMASNIPLLAQRNEAVAPKEMATIFRDRRHTWRDFAERLSRFAAGLRALGLNEGDRVAMLGLNSDRYLEFFYGTSWAGLVFVPINIRLAAPEVVHWMSDSGSKALIVDDAFLPMVPALTPHLPELQHLIYAGEGDTPDGMIAYEDLVSASGMEASARGGDDLAGLFYTGGTTGRSKGVMLSHGNLMHNAMVLAHHWQPGPGTIGMHTAPMFHIADSCMTFTLTAAGGAHTFVPSFTPQATLETISKEGVTTTIMVPVMINMLVNFPDVANYDLSTLELIGYGASPMPQAVLEKAIKLIPDCEFSQAYGQTEAAPLLTTLPPERHVFEGPLAGKAGSVGRPVIGMDVRIVDDAGQEVPRGEVAEICARGPSIMLGYWNLPEKTAEVSTHGWHRTGDAGYMDEDGFIFIVDRLKDMVISGGENVYSAEVENALYSHADVVECAVIGVPDEEWGERVHAVVRLAEGASQDAKALIDHCRDLIAGFKVPKSVDFVTDPLPLSGAGKILKTELRKPYWEGLDKAVN